MEISDKLQEYSAEYLVANYKALLPPFLSDGLPSADTVRGYCSDIGNFLAWCGSCGLDPVAAERHHLISYRKYLMEQDLKSVTISRRLVAIRKFYDYLMEYHIVRFNPVSSVHAYRKGDSEDITFKFFTKKQLKDILDATTGDDEKSLRNRAMVMLMGLEGLRTVEVHRLNAEDVNFVRHQLYIRGKGHNDTMVIRKDTAEALRDYMEVRNVSVSEVPVPVFTSFSNRSKGRRISRTSIRKCINGVLDGLGLHVKGHSCHTLRHTVGTLLCDATKDLNYVKKALRHRSIEMASHYSHILKDRETGLSDIIDLD